MNRKPILLSNHAVALIHVFTKEDDFNDVILGVWEQYNSSEIWEEAAREFVRQLDDMCAPVFMEALRNEIDKWLKKGD